METQATPLTGRQATARDLVAVVFRQKWIILTVFAITTVSVGLFTLQTPVTYESAARLQVYRGRVESAQNQNLRLLSWEEEMSSELETVRSYPVSQRAQEILDSWREDGTLSDPIRLNRGGVEARVIGESNVLEVSYTSEDATVCRPVTDALARAYAEFRREALTIPGMEEFFQGEVERAQRELRELEQAKIDFVNGIGPHGLPTSRQTLVTLLTQVEFELRGTEQRLEQLRRQHAALRSMDLDESIETAAFLELKFENASTLRDLSDKVIKARLLRDEKAATMMPNHPEYRAADETLRSAEQMLRQEIRATIALLESEIAERTQWADRMRREAAQHEANIERIPANEVTLAQFDSRIEIMRQELEDLHRKYTSSRINLATAPSVTVTLLSPAGAPRAKKTKDYVRIALAPLMSIVVGLLLAFFLDSLDHTLRTPADVEEHLGLPVLAALPESQR